MKFRLIPAILAIAFGWSSAARADWSEEFTGGFSNPWIFADDSGNVPADRTNITIHPNNFLDMQAKVGAPYDLFVAGFNPTQTFTNVAATASVGGGRGVISNNDLFLTVRSNGSSGYLIALDLADGGVDLVRVNAGAIVGLGAGSSGNVPGFSAQGTYTLQLSAFGSNLFGQVRDGSGAVKAIVSATDSGYTSGWTGIGAAINSDVPATSATPIAAGFDNVASIAVTAGSSPNNPLLPSNTSAPWNFVNVPGDGRWFDPVPAIGYTYTTNGASNFTAVILPTGPAYDLDNQYVIDYGAGPTPITGGSLFVFPSPVANFTVTGIFAPVDGSSPTAFPTFLSFDQLQVTYTQTPIPVIPEPSTLALAGMGAIGLVVARRRNNCRAA